MNTTALTLALILNLQTALCQSGRIDERLLCPAGAGVHAAQPAPRPEPAPAVAPVRQLVIAVGSTTVVQMASKRPIASVFIEKEGIIRVQPVDNDPTRIRVTGVAPGITRLTLQDVDGQREIHDLGKRGK